MNDPATANSHRIGNGVVHFGIFDLNLRAGELRKGGVKIKLDGQPLNVLVALLERPGQVVTREELKQRLWGNDTFVDFEQGLNKAVNKARQALGDSADRPTFIETLPRKGYRFIKPVEILRAEQKPQTEDRQATPATRNLAMIAAGLACAAASVALAAMWYARPGPPVVTNAVQISDDKRPKPLMIPAVTDGVRLYFMEGAALTTGTDIAQISTTGGETTLIHTSLPRLAGIFAISPDHSELLVANGTENTGGPMEVWVQPLPGGTPHRVGEIHATSACWTPDGRQILYADKGEIFLGNLEGAQRHEVAKMQGLVHGLRYSPDGHLVRFSVMNVPELDASSIWEMDPTGKNLHRLFADWKESPYQCCGEWSADGDYYYFESGQGNEQAIWVLPEHASIMGALKAWPSRLTAGPLRYSVPVPSADGKRLFVIGDQVRVEPLRYDVHTRRFDTFLHGLTTGPFDFSPDGKWLTYVSYPNMTLWKCRADGTENVQLTFPPVRAYSPRWSPDGSLIAFLDVQFYKPWRIRLMPASGGSPELFLPNGKDETEDDPTWTPDGKSIVFSKFSKSTAGPNIYRADVNSKSVTAVPGSKGFFSPRVSPDGRYICALTIAEDKLKLFDTASKQWTTLAGGELLNYNEWSHDGKYIYLRWRLGGSGEVVRVNLKNHAIEHVLSLKDFPQVVDNLTWWIGLTPDDAPVLVRDRSVQEIYALDLRPH